MHAFFFFFFVSQQVAQQQTDVVLQLSNVLSWCFSTYHGFLIRNWYVLTSSTWRWSILHPARLLGHILIAIPQCDVQECELPLFCQYFGIHYQRWQRSSWWHGLAIKKRTLVITYLEQVMPSLCWFYVQLNSRTVERQLLFLFTVVFAQLCDGPFWLCHTSQRQWL